MHRPATDGPASPSRCSPAARPVRPKRVDAHLRDARRGCSPAPSTTSATRAPSCGCAPGVVIVNSPLVHLGGLFRVLQCVNDGRSFCLLERFTVDEWVDAVRRHRPATVEPRARRAAHGARGRPRSRRPRAASARWSRGTAPLDPDDADAFREQYGVPVLISYAATEFGGGVAGWNLADHERVLGGQAGQRRPGPPGLRAAGRRRRDAATPLGARRGGPARGEGPPARRRHRLDPHHRPRPHRRRRLPLDPRPGRPGDHPRRLQGPARRRARRARARPRGAGRGGRRAAPTPASARCPVAAVELRPGAAGRRADDLLAARRRRCSPATSCPTSSGSSTRCRAPARARSTSPPCASCSAVER